MNISSINQTQFNNLSANRNNYKKNAGNPSFNGVYDKATTWLAKNYTAKLYTSSAAEFLSNKTEKLDSVINGMQILGSVIVSGMYMIQTLLNKKLDEERRRTLAVNQGLTFVAATVGGLVADKKLDKAWERFTKNFALRQLKNESQKERLMREVDISKRGATQKFVKEVLGKEKLASTLNGMGIMKKLLIFTTMYRFIVPVAVTPLANILGDMYNEHKAKKN